ncbi:MAG TPA: hypothetical protein VE263_12745 [Candidatus Angelobacter sp.]|nr:hypothetical protein [Candidatus Angelobacter sp.]
MATHYDVRELAWGLQVEVHQDLERWQRLLVAGFAGTWVGGMSAYFLGAWWWTIFSVIAALAAFGVKRGRSAELQVTNVEFISRGLGRRVRKRIVCMGDVRRLEFREGSTFMPGYGGLYAVTPNGTTLLLPMLDFDATAKVVRAIENKFPGLAEGWRSGQLFTEHVRTESKK